MITQRTLRIVALALPLLALGAGCKQESGVESTTKATAPDGSTTEVTRSVEVEQTGDNPPPVNP